MMRSTIKSTGLLLAMLAVLSACMLSQDAAWDEPVIPTPDIAAFEAAVMPLYIESGPLPIRLTDPDDIDAVMSALADAEPSGEVSHRLHLSESLDIRIQDGPGTGGTLRLTRGFDTQGRPATAVDNGTGAMRYLAVWSYDVLEALMVDTWADAQLNLELGVIEPGYSFGRLNTTSHREDGVLAVQIGFSGAVTHRGRVEEIWHSLGEALPLGEEGIAIDGDMIPLRVCMIGEDGAALGRYLVYWGTPVSVGRVVTILCDELTGALSYLSGDADDPFWYYLA